MRRVLSESNCGVEDVEGAIDALVYLGLMEEEGGEDSISSYHTMNNKSSGSDRNNSDATDTDAIPHIHVPHSTSHTPSPKYTAITTLTGRTPIDALSDVLATHRGLAYQKGERDMVAMYHTVVGEMPDGTKERHTSRLLAFGSTKITQGSGSGQSEGESGGVEGGESGGVEGGEGGGGVVSDDGDSAMSATVGYTIAAGVELILQLSPYEGHKPASHGPYKPTPHKSNTDTPHTPLGGRTGVFIPTTPDIYEPVLLRLNDFGITWTESITVEKGNKN